MFKKYYMIFFEHNQYSLRLKKYIVSSSLQLNNKKMYCDMLITLMLLILAVFEIKPGNEK